MRQTVKAMKLVDSLSDPSLEITMEIDEYI